MFSLKAAHSTSMISYGDDQSTVADPAPSIGDAHQWLRGGVNRPEISGSCVVPQNSKDSL